MAADRPDVLLISADHWPGSLLGAAGHPAIQTPTLDQLANNGIRFTRAYSPCPVCIAARRTLMTGTTPRTHGDRCFNETLPMPAVPTLAQTFRQAGYQAYAVGKMHVYPQRHRVGFNDVVLNEEGRLQFGAVDDYELALGDAGYAGQQFLHGMSSNEYAYRPWHLPEALHSTTWTTRQMARMMARRDPTRPAFWYVSYQFPHPPLVPLQIYLDMYRDVEPPAPYVGEWARALDGRVPNWIRHFPMRWEDITAEQTRWARRAFYAQCTHIDHQIRVLIGTLREQGLRDNTIILFTSDHGDMLGNHGFWSKGIMYEDSARVPLILCGVEGDARVGHHRVDDRLAAWQDIMPTLLELAGIPVPDTVEGISLVGERRREWLYGEYEGGSKATRMVHDGRYKLIYYAAGNTVQLFDLQTDPQEMHDLADAPAHRATRERLTQILIGQLYGGDEAWVRDGRLVGLPPEVYEPITNRGLSGQRGTHWPIPGPGFVSK